MVIYTTKIEYSNTLNNYLEWLLDIKIAFGLVLRRVRKEGKKKMSQERLALEADIDRAHVSKLEQGAFQPTLATIFELAKVLECTPAELVDLVDKELRSNQDI